jgi:Mn-containing catalase
VVATGNLKMDMLHNFVLECGARAQKIRAYELTKDPTARAAVGYLLVRGGVHIVAYAKALEKLSGVNVGGLLPIPDVSNERFPEAKKHMREGSHRTLDRFSPTDYTHLAEIWSGTHPEDGSELVVEDGPSEGFDPPDLDAEPQLAAPVGPDLDPDLMKHYSKKLFG